jgi:hypothetical protein
VEAARCLVDKHVVKMCIESAQLLCTAAWINGRWNPALYKPTHIHHPCTLWTAKTSENWDWLLLHALEIASEYKRRYGRTHASLEKIVEAADLRPPDGELTKFALAMPDAYKTDDAVESYRTYYAIEKRRFAHWKPPAAQPDWWDKHTNITTKENIHGKEAEGRVRRGI